ncbi:ABC transporter substrate-binding protein [Paenibacillus sacheonensis]|uniref:ABC transporter substrate-binding protein n=1 Tax=Paenibacillus sacheonensis TaxID=742054 RepID=A0A7X4YUF8_9BACL|nr:ABC transporter substrate-binding protein [Paenibacillus sacheonensis]MBM7568203.1 MarR-like DNA-binding transcriptional regulator SgrR of sgrS sRNA [Paenibacillus sacheonensis]NBC71799.1 ABC transporter substrate-binding protein [Paenibacillus sacheonensis]
MQGVHAERYLELYSRFAERGVFGAPIEATLGELAQALYCTARNAKLILRRMEEEGWIHWRPGLGRGNRSHIVFRAERETVLLDAAKAFAGKESYKQAFELILNHGEGTLAKDRFNEWLTRHFGYRSEGDGGERQVDTLRLPVHVPLVTLDPAEVYYAFDAHIIRQLFDRLVRFDPAADRVSPALAHAWECSADAKRWQFHLRRGVFFHHGHELDAEDVRFTLERLRDDRSNSWLLRNVVAIETAGRSVAIELAKPNRIFHRFLCSTAASILPKDAILLDEEAFWRQPSGTGPFRFAEWNEDRFTLKANADYYQGRAHLDGVVIAFVPADQAAQSAHCWERLAFDHDDKERKGDSGDSWAEVESLLQGCMLLTWNRRMDGPQRSPLFRKAIDLLLDRSRMVEELGEERIYAARGFRPGAHTPLRHVRCDGEQARGLLRDAAYGGEPFTILTRPVHMLDATWMQARCAEFGVPVEIRLLDGHDHRDEEVLREADAILYSLVFAEDEVCEIETYEQRGSFLNAHMDPQLLDWAKERIDLAVASPTTEQRRFLLDEIEERVREETQVLFLLHKKSHKAYKPSLRGIALSPLGWIDFKDVWVQSGEGEAPPEGA